MRRNAYMTRLVRLPLYAIGLILCFVYTGFAGPKDQVVIKVKDSSQLQAVAARYGLKTRKSLRQESGGLLIVDADKARALKLQIEADSAVEWVEDDPIIPLDDNNETVLPLDDNNETVLPLGVVVQPLDDNNETVLPLDDNNETVLPLDDNNETVLPLDAIIRIKQYFNWAAPILTPSKTLLLQWPFMKIGLYDAAMRATGHGIVVADLNTGVDTCHPVLAGTLQISFVDETTIPENCPTAATPHVPGFGHGTAVGGIIKLIAPEATLWSLRVFDSSGTAKASDIVEAIMYAADHGAQVINMSFGSVTQSQAIADAITYAYNRGVIMIAAAGNDGVEGMRYPAANSKVKGVIAVTTGDVKAPFSNYGFTAFASAPAVKVWVPFPDRQMSLASGTSYASPMVAADAVLLLSGYAETHTSAPSRSTLEIPLGAGSKNIDLLNLVQFKFKLGKGRILIPKAEDMLNIH